MSAGVIVLFVIAGFFAVIAGGLLIQEAFLRAGAWIFKRLEAAADRRADRI